VSALGAEAVAAVANMVEAALIAAASDERSDGGRLGEDRARGWRPGRVTWRRLQAAGLGAFIEPAAIAWSDELGVAKPRPEIFPASLRALGASPRQAAHVGNSPTKDVAEARRLGMTAIRYAGVCDEAGDGPPAHAVVRHLATLPDVLRGLAA
jgi:FMN phosphatase YigB (HAD superfamily)